MASTKRTLSSQILRRLSSGDRSVGSRFDPREIDAALMQQLNFLLRPQFFENLQAGAGEMEGFLLCTYDNQAVVSYKGVSKTTLPAIPVNLPKNQGIHRVYNSNDVLYGAFIPASAGEMELIASQPILSNLLGQIAYKPRGSEIIYNKDLTALTPVISVVSLELVVADFNHFTDYDLLPINAELEAQVVENVVKMFAPEPPQPKIVDPTNDSK